jgi:hypothetical protein
MHYLSLVINSGTMRRGRNFDTSAMLFMRPNTFVSTVHSSWNVINTSKNKSMPPSSKKTLHVVGDSSERSQNCNVFLLHQNITHSFNALLYAILPYLRVYKPHFLTRIYPPKIGCGLYTEYYALLTTEPATPVLYVVKLPVETASVWDLSCKLLHMREYANILSVYRHVLITWE